MRSNVSRPARCGRGCALRNRCSGILLLRLGVVRSLRLLRSFLQREDGSLEVGGPYGWPYVQRHILLKV